MERDQPTRLTAGEDVRKNWRTINELGTLEKRLAQRLNEVDSLLADIKYRSHIKETGGSGSSVKRFRVVQEFGDHIKCNQVVVDGGAGPTSFRVAKPYFLRFSTWGGFRTMGDWAYGDLGGFSERSATYFGSPVLGGIQANDTVREFMEPPYIVPDLSGVNNDIYATEPIGSTGVWINPETDATVSSTFPGGLQLSWLDINVDARRFITRRERLNVCVIENGQQVTRRIVVDGGPRF